MPANLRVIEGGEKGSEEWAKKIRESIKALSKNIDTAYIDLAQKLFEIHTTSAYGDSNRGAVWRTLWGYDSFGDYTETELNLHPKRAERLVRIWQVLHVDLAEIPDSIRQRILHLGSSKLRELVSVLTVKNAAVWAEKGEKLSFLELRRQIQKSKDARDKRITERAAKEREGEEVEPTGDEEYDEAGAVAAYESEGLGRKIFDLFPEQREIVDTALQRSAELSDSDKPGHNLTLICQEFLATNDFTRADEKQRIRFLQKFERLMDIQLVIVDKKTKDVMYGLKTLEDLAASDK